MAKKTVTITTEMKKAVGKRLKESRERAGLSQIDLAVDMGLTQVSVSNMENGKYLITSETLIALNELYGMDPSYILTGRSANGINATMENFISWFSQLEDDSPMKSGASRVCEGLMLSYKAENGDK